MKGEGNGLRPAFVFSLVLVGCLILPGRAASAVITPDTTADEYDTTPDATCSLREAVQSAEQGSDFGGCIAGGSYTGDDRIELDPGSYVLTRLPSGSNFLDTGDLDVGATDLTVEGPPSQAPGGATIDGFGVDRIFKCVGGLGSLTLRGLTITDGAATVSGAGITTSGGGILANTSCPLTISDSTITANVTDGFGGGVASTGPVVLTNVTVSNNFSAELTGGGLAAFGDGSLSLEHVTVTNNQTQSTDPNFYGGGLFVNALSPVATTVHNSIIAGNLDASGTADGPDCEGPIISSGGNVIGSTAGCTFTSMPSDALNVDAALGPLMNNGGTTMTHALLTDSPAIDRAVGASPFTDQRGFARPFPVGGACDSGAYEFGAALSVDTPGCQPPPIQPTPTPPSTTIPTTVPPGLRCATLRKRLRKAKRAGNTAKVRKLRRKLRRCLAASQS
jgi:CSLREA domain-containing protein